MTKLRSIVGLPEILAARWAAQGIHSVERLWERLATPRFHDVLGDLVDGTGFTVEEVHEIIVDDAAERHLRSKPFEESGFGEVSQRGFLRRHLPDVIVMVVVAFLLAAIWLAGVPPAQKATVAAAPLPAGWVIGEGDVETAMARHVDGLADLRTAIGRSTFQALADGEVVREKNLGPQVPSSSLVVALPLVADGLPLRGGQMVSLLIGVGEERRAIVERALVLGVGTNAATFAVDSRYEGTLSRYDPKASVIPFLPARPEESSEEEQ